MSNNQENNSKNNIFSTYTDSIQFGLDKGLQYVKYFKQLVTTKDPAELLESTEMLTKSTLDSQYVTFPHQFSNEDVQLIFMTRLLKLTGLADNFKIKDSEYVQKLYGVFDSVEDETFSFAKSQVSTTGYYLNASSGNQPLMYLNIPTKELLFNGPAIIDFFVVELKDTEADKIKAALTTLINFGKVLKEKAGFKTDFNVLDGVNEEFYEFAAGNIAEEIMDELFVKSAEENYILMADEDNNAFLTLNAKTKLIIADKGNEDQHKYGAFVQDDDQTENWVFLLLDYPFIRDWYLANSRQLEIMADQIVFG
ncbi:hypothetical protein [Lentilactobacillus sp. Marseille-Q4993]|uniref:hypothetical protein n=1 Tax=Lentilactobacillus sp. Marseille-Q4993 TaxID=3039492 RepID=UPI0024BC8853|nr:hypothetical protein [Lentilactobacillus sp. Marseille-Q4993]